MARLMVSLSVFLFSLATYFEDHDRFLTSFLCHGGQFMTDEIRSASSFKTFIKQIRNSIFEV